MYSIVSIQYRYSWKNYLCYILTVVYKLKSHQILVARKTVQCTEKDGSDYETHPYFLRCKVLSLKKSSTFFIQIWIIIRTDLSDFLEMLILK